MPRSSARSGSFDDLASIQAAMGARGRVLQWAAGAELLALIEACGQAGWLSQLQEEVSPGALAALAGVERERADDVLAVLVAAEVVEEADGLFRLSAEFAALTAGASGVSLDAVLGLAELQRTRLTAALGGSDEKSMGGEQALALETNTNLEQVSDWLTKIIVGVGLVQLGRALPALAGLARSLNDPLGGKPYSGPFGLGLTIFYALLGFLFLYLWSRTNFTRELQQLTGIIQTQINKVESTLSNALTLVDRQLNSLNGGQKPTQSELNQAVAAAPDSTRLQIFHQAENVRNMNRESNKELMELTIPVFCALIAADADNKYHRNHGSLGWALKDKSLPDWREAKAELTKAIAIRIRLGIIGWRVYEASRAVCSINILNDSQPGDPTPAEISASIEQDLATAQGDPHVKPMTDPDSPTVDPDIKQWILHHPLSGDPGLATTASSSSGPGG